MSNSDFIYIHHQDKVVFKEQTPEKWVCFVEKDGFLKADFLQTKTSLELEVHLSGENAKCEINCAYLLNENSKLKLKTKVIHEYKNTRSKQLIKGLATDSSEMNFDATISIPKDSQKCDGVQNHRGILLSPKAKIIAIPQLEIWADDVQCAHGSAVGPLNLEELFYLESRGIPKLQARRLLLQSFFGDLMSENFNNMIQKWMEENV